MLLSKPGISVSKRRWLTMPAYKIGITEAGDAGVDLSWVDKMGSVDGAVLITKCISPNFVDAAMKFKDKIWKPTRQSRVSA
jgi:hypothetical protein